MAVGLEVDGPSRDVRIIIGEVVDDMRGELDNAAGIVSESIHSQCRGLDDELYLSTRQSTRANISLINAMLAEGTDPTDLTAPEEALSYARSYVHEGLTMDTLSAVYRQGQRSYSRLWLERLKQRAGSAEELADAMGYFSDWLFAYIEEINRPLSEVYTAEHERVIRGGLAVRSEEVRSILAGGPVNVTEASSRLRYRLDGRHIGFVIWSDAPAPCETTVGDAQKVFGEMDRMASEVAEALGATSCLSLPIGRCYAGWACVSGDPELETLSAAGSGLRIATGRVGRGVEGFRRTHAEAMMARRVANLSTRQRSDCFSFGSVALDALMTNDLGEARRFVVSELGTLMADSDSARRLAATLEVFLHEESSFVRAARRLGIHENTVAYRVRRAEELLGRKAGDRQLELRAALRLARLVRVQEQATA